ncbi:GlxA family transcriptional regulator [Streptomyces sp. NPDC090025]|uniref:GlxA family transcriptional regulator n=1 Tax=Streptomyces sp. NPDC090025 TaxID=3365922 RepID=UPI003836082A
MGRRTALVVLFDGTDALDVVSPLELLSAANVYAATRPGGDLGNAGDGAGAAGRRPEPPYRVLTASPGGAPVRSPSGLTLMPDIALEAAPVPHTVIVPGPYSGEGAIAIDPDVVRWLRGNAARCRRVVGLCTGPFVLAAAGLLAGKRVTTHWSMAARLAAAHPEVRVDADPIFIRDGRIATSAGGTSAMDLMLALIEEDLGHEAATTLARHLVVFLRRPGTQRQFSTHLRAQLADRQSLRDVQDWIATHPDTDLTIGALARRANLSTRQFTRAFTAETGTPPGRYVDQTRLETARRLLEDSKESVAAVARGSGYPSTEAMRRAFQRALGMSPLQYRRRF